MLFEECALVNGGRYHVELELTQLLIERFDERSLLNRLLSMKEITPGADIRLMHPGIRTAEMCRFPGLPMTIECGVGVRIDNHSA